MYTLMNKDIPLIDFEFESSDLVVSEEIKEVKVYNRPWFIQDLRIWADKRHAPKHRANIENLLSQLGLRTTRAMLDFSKGLSLTDTLWVNKDDKYSWDKINLFDNHFDDVIAKVAFDGGMHGRNFSTTSPELTTDGAFAKCWIREPGGRIFLIKQGSSGASNTGLEPYSEQYCSEVLDVLGYNHVNYVAVSYHGVTSSKCQLLTEKKTMMLPMAQCVDEHGVLAVARYCEENSMLERLYEMFIFDYLVTNDDRHLNNIGVLLDSDTFEVKGLAPIYDNGSGLLPYAVKDNLATYESMCVYASGKGPRFYRDFFQEARNALSRIDAAPVRKLLNFSFRRDHDYHLPEERLDALEDYVRGQAKNLLDGVDPVEAALNKQNISRTTMEFL